MSWIGVLFVHVVFDVMVEYAVNDEGSNNAGCRPRGEQSAMDGRDVETAEEVLEIGRNGRETSAIHRDDQRSDRDEEGNGVNFVLPRKGKEEVEDGTEYEEGKVSAFASYEVRERRPEETARPC